MRPHTQLDLRHSRHKGNHAQHFSFILLALFLCFLPLAKAVSSPQDKIQQTVDAIRGAYNNTDDDYLTDGQRTVWVKSYKKWRPEDWATVQKEAPHVIKFLKQAIEHHRPDVLQQLMPDYYRTHGGMQAFERDIKDRK